MAGVITVALFILLMAAITYFGYRHYARPARIFEQVGAPVPAPEHRSPGVLTEGPGIVVRTISQIGEQVPVSPHDASLTRKYLMAAGYRSERAVKVFYGLKVVLCVVFFVAAIFLKNYITSVAVLRMVLLVGAALAGYFAPGMVLERLVSKRQERLRYALPDALDLMVVSVEAGLGLDQALQSVSRELELTHREIAEEFELVNLEMRAGKRRSDALKNLADRTGQAEIRQLVAVLVQTDRFGTSMAEALRTHSDFMRIRRRQEAEERANKVGVKLVFPIFFCIMPSMFIVVGGSAVIQIFKYLIPLLRQASEH